MYDTESLEVDKCTACETKNCEKCDAKIAVCTKCDQGYEIILDLANNNATSCSVVANETLAPCGPGYYKDQTDFKCKACKGGCKRCSSDSNCF